MKILTEIEAERYGRQTLFWGEEKQSLLNKKKVLVLGAGGLGSPVLFYLAAAGVGTIKVFDYDTVSLSNLNRQILHGLDRVGLNKGDSAYTTLHNFNNQIEIIPVQEKLDEDNFLQHVEGYDLFIDVCDNMETKEKLNRYVVANNISTIVGVAVGSGGYTFLNTPDSLCLACLFNQIYGPVRKRVMPFDALPSFGASVGMIGTAIANISVRYLLGNTGQFLNSIFYAPQLWDLTKLMVIEKVFSVAMTPHFKSTVKDQTPKFPYGENLIERNSVESDPDCRVCKNRVVPIACPEGEAKRQIGIEL